MAGPQSESKTALNPGSGGDSVRDFIITLADGTTAKIQAISVVDPLNPSGVQRVSDQGEASVFEAVLRDKFDVLIAEIKLLRLVIQGSSDQQPDTAIEPIELLGDVT